jgi:hypothetical protein
MATRAQITRLAQRIDELAARFRPLDEPPPERWVVDGDRAYQLSNPNEVITVAELEARPTKRTSFPTRIVRVIIDPVASGTTP